MPYGADTSCPNRFMPPQKPKPWTDLYPRGASVCAGDKAMAEKLGPTCSRSGSDRWDIDTLQQRPWRVLRDRHGERRT